MSEKKHELLLIAAALFISTVTILYSIFDSPKYNSLEAVKITVTEIIETTTVPSGKVNINTASAEELMQLEGIGEKKALAIIEYREKNGSFRIAEELSDVEGIGEKIFEDKIGRIAV